MPHTLQKKQVCKSLLLAVVLELLAFESWRRWVEEEENVVDDVTCIVVWLDDPGTKYFKKRGRSSKTHTGCLDIPIDRFTGTSKHPTYVWPPPLSEDNYF